MKARDYTYNWSNCKIDIINWEWHYYVVRFFCKDSYAWAKTFDKKEDAEEYLDKLRRKEILWDKKYNFSNNQPRIYWTVDRNPSWSIYCWYIWYNIDNHIVTDTTKWWCVNTWAELVKSMDEYNNS